MRKVYRYVFFSVRKVEFHTSYARKSFAAPTLVRVDHSMLEIQLYTLVTKTTVYTKINNKESTMQNQIINNVIKSAVPKTLIK